MPRSPRRRPALIVPLSRRPKDDGVIDYPLIRQALTGWTSSARELTRRELTAAVHIGTARPYSKSAAELADLLLLDQRYITDFRGENFPDEVFTCPLDPADLVDQADTEPALAA